MDDEIEDQLECGYDPFADDSDYTLGYDDDFSLDDSVYVDLSEIVVEEESQEEEKDVSDSENLEEVVETENETSDQIEDETEVEEELNKTSIES